MFKKLLAAVWALAGMSAFGVVSMPEVVSHRGESNDRPENTMAAFRLAFERGVDGVECDVYCTSDGTPVIIHDETTARTATLDPSLTVTSSTWDQLKDIRVGAFGKWIGTEWEGETLPKFSDYLALLSMNATTKCVVELKGNGVNSLVAKVVEAVQAQPLATPDRVVFIAFDASLISAVRTALPDYDALLLLSNVSDSSATIKSRIAACGGTGVDIHYQAAACSSESEIAAVKADGYKFWIWTCDSINESFALASRGVESVTTNKGGETKTSLAAMVANAESHEEIVNPNFPEGTTLLDAGAYVQSGLVAHFDGIRNAGADLPHDSTTRTWKNLVSGKPDAVFTVADKGYWNAAGTGFFFPGGVAAYLQSGLDIGTTFTVQMATDIDYTKQHTKNTTGSAGVKGQYPTFFYANGKDLGFYFNNTGSTTSRELIFKHNDSASAWGSGTRPSILSWGGKYVTGIIMSGKSYLVEGVTLGSGQAFTTGSGAGAQQYSWGGSKTDTSRSVYGTYHAVRIYTKVLSDDELAWNRILDDARFHGVMATGCVQVETNRKGAEGTEASGIYYVNGSHTFTTPAEVTIDGCIYEPAGYKLENYNASKKAWDFVEASDATSFAYTNCAAATGVRITWNWCLKSGVKKIDADDYLQAGLVFGFDGIRNAGLGAAHDSSATTWRNYGSGGDFTLTTFDAEAGAGAWKEKGYFFTAGSCFYADRDVTLGRQATIQFAADHNMSLQTAKWPSIFGPGSVDADRYNLYTYTARSGTAEMNRGDHLRFNTVNINGSSMGVQPWDGRFCNAIIDNARSGVFATAAYDWQAGTQSADIGTYRYAIGAARSSAGNRKDRAYTGEIHAFRLYDRVLTEAELAYNMAIDNCRYYAGSGRSTETNLVEIASSLPGVEIDDLGCWILRGDGASKTFSAPATVTVGNCTYSCTGYRLETWNAAKRMWENPVETTGALMAELSSANQNRRLTWLFTLTAGIRSAADYDVHDYVQQGLVANYDGIRNIGAANAHSLLGMFWHDCSYRDVPMLAASNTAFSAWIGLGHHFTVAENSTFRTTEALSLAYSFTIQAVMDAPPGSGQTAGRSGNYWPTYFGASENDHGMFTVKTGTELAWKMDSFLYDNSTSYPRAKLQNFGGEYINAIVDGTSANKVYLSQTTAPGSGVNLKKKKEVNAQTWSIGGPNTDNLADIKPRTINGDYYAFRIYNRALTEAELAHNRTVDEIRYRGVFTNANVTVACEVPFEGVDAPVSMPAGEYEVTGSWTFTANGVTVGESTFPPRYTVETWTDGAWSAPEEHDGASYTYVADGAKVRLTWKWADPTVPVKATWTGGGDVGNLLDPANWNSVNAAGDTIVAAPTNVTAVIINGTTSFSIPDGVTEFPWKEIQIGGDVHTALRCGTWNYNSNSGYTGTTPGVFTLLPASETALSNLDNGSYSTTPSAWQASHLYRQRVRFDGWVYVTPEQAGTWTVNQKFDDYYGFAIDGEWVIANPTYQALLIGTCEVSAGWHRFTIICGDTGGNGWGAYPASAVQVEGVDAPMSVSWGDAAVRFAPANFTFGTDAAPAITLSCDCDWSALGELTVLNGATIDLNGHNLTVQALASDYMGAMITNSNDEVLSTFTVTVPEGKTVTGGVAICGNVKVVKKGAGTYRGGATGCTYTGGTFIDEGTAQPPDGSGTDIQYCYDRFNAFGLGEIVVASGATFDLRANYAYRNRIVLNGGSLVNTKADMTSTGNGGSGIGRLMADSYLGVTNHIVFGDNNGHGDMDLDGNTLTARIEWAKYLYLRCASITNGTMDFTYGGWLKPVVACDARTVDFKVACALDIANALSVRDYEALWASDTKTHNAGTAALNVYGAFKPVAGQKFYGCTMQDGSAIDLSGFAGAFSTLSYYTSGSTSLVFAPGATVTVNLNGREDIRDFTAKDADCIVTWPADKAPAADVTFVPDSATKRRGIRIVRDDEANGLRLVYRGGTTVIVR